MAFAATGASALNPSPAMVAEPDEGHDVPAIRAAYGAIAGA
jgi:hypothetical protein